MKGFTSRKFLICAAAFLGSIGTSIAALHSDNQAVASVGIVCAILSAAIYAAVEAYVDGKAVQNEDIYQERVFDIEGLRMDDFDEDDEDEEVIDDVEE